MASSTSSSKRKTGGAVQTPLETYLREINETPLLSAQEERELGIASLAARFAAKEALAKSLGAPAGLHWTDARVVTDDVGKPSLEIGGSIQARANDLGVDRFHVSLSHDAGVASAVVIAEG